MSRGNFRGRGRGRGGAPYAGPHPAAGIGTMSRDEWGEALRAPAKHSGMLFPVSPSPSPPPLTVPHVVGCAQPLDQNTTSHLPAPSVSEDTLISLSLSLAAHIAAHGPKLASERKVVGIGMFP